MRAVRVAGFIATMTVMALGVAWQDVRDDKAENLRCANAIHRRVELLLPAEDPPANGARLESVDSLRTACRDIAAENPATISVTGARLVGAFLVSSAEDVRSSIHQLDVLGRGIVTALSVVTLLVVLGLGLYAFTEKDFFRAVSDAVPKLLQTIALWPVSASLSLILIYVTLFVVANLVAHDHAGSRLREYVEYNYALEYTEGTDTLYTYLMRRDTANANWMRQHDSLHAEPR